MAHDRRSPGKTFKEELCLMESLSITSLPDSLVEKNYILIFQRKAEEVSTCVYT